MQVAFLVRFVFVAFKEFNKRMKFKTIIIKGLSSKNGIRL